MGTLLIAYLNLIPFFEEPFLYPLAKDCTSLIVKLNSLDASSFDLKDLIKLPK